MSTIIWVKPNGNELETNDRNATVQYCESLGWKRKTSAKKTSKGK